MLFQQTITNLSIKQWYFQDKENRHLLLVTIILMVLSFGWLKYIYPFPNFMPPDSYNYLEAANNNDFINIWPIGYSKFLRLINIFTRSDIALVILQYLLLIGSVFYFLITIRYLLSPNKWLFRSLLVISITNPLLPHIANFVSSDSLFITISLVWFTQLLWIIFQPTQKLLLFHAIIILLAFMIRFTAIWYPFFSLSLIALLNIPRKTKLIGIGSLLILLLIFIGRTQYEYKIKTNTIQYAAFGGWQIASNALYGYAYADSINIIKVPDQFKELHALVNRHMDSIHHLQKRPDTEPGVYYLWDFKSPLVLYLHKQLLKSKKEKYFKNWAQLAPLYSQYGRWLISQRPIPFFKHYVWPNLLKYYSPPPFFMGMYNLGNKSVDPIAVIWFGWKNNQLHGRFQNFEINVINIFPHLIAIINPAFFIFFIFFTGCFSGLNKCSKISKKILVCFTLVWLSNTFFSVLSAPIELRYQIFPIVITLPFCILLLSGIIGSLQTKSEINPKIKNTITKNGLST